MSWKRRARGGIIGFIGFMLSPLSWWNDLFVNVPLALCFGWLVSFVYKPAFEIAVIVGYWLSNLLGLLLLHKGARQILHPETSMPYSGRDLIRDIAISLLYTALIAVLIRLKVLQPIAGYLTPR